MKKILKLSFVTLLAVLALTVVSYAATGGGKHHKAGKENKKFSSVTFVYSGSDETTASIEDPDNWAQTTPPCTTGNVHLCAITFDTSDFPLDGGKPNSTLLIGVAGGWASVKPSHSGVIIISGHNVTIILKS